MAHKLEYVINEEVQTFYLAKDEISAGKMAGNDLELNDRTISRNHCRFIREGDGYKIIDLNSTNGTYVNGQRIDERLLKEGDNIAIGRTILKYLAVEEDETYDDIDDQKISMMIPLSEEIRVEPDTRMREQELEFLTSLTALSRSLISSSSLENSLEKIGELIFRYVNLRRLFIFSFDDKQDDLHLIHSQTRKGNPVKKVNISKTIAMKSIKEKVAILSSNTQDDARFTGSESIILYGITSAISVPIWTKNSIYGLVYADSTHFEELFAEKDLEILSIIANFIGLAIEGINSMKRLNRERKIRARLERYHSPAVVTRIMEAQDDPSSELMDYKESDASVLFMDIVGFTGRVERMTPTETGIFLNNFFTEMTDIIFQHNGTLDKYIGDAIMAVFGVPLPVKNHTDAALSAALDMIDRMDELNRETPKEDRIHIRIGVHSGKLISGDFGSPKRYDYTVLGNTVNIASRLESAVASADEIVVSKAVRKAAGSRFRFKELGCKKLHGISAPMDCYALLGNKGEK